MASSGIARERFLELNGIPVRLRLGSFAAEVLGWGFIRPHPWRNNLHTHSMFEICYAFAGQGRFRMQGVEYAVRDGDVFIAKPGEEHEIIATGANPLGIYFWSYTLVPAGSAGDPAVDALLQDFLDSRQWVSNRVPGMESTLRLLTEEAVRREPGFTTSISALAGKLILDTARAATGPARAGEALPAPAPPKEGIAVERARRYMQDNLARQLSLRDIAMQTGLSERHLTRLFRRMNGLSPMQYLLERRIEAAGQLLLGSTPIKDIAARVGYADVRYFTTVFRQATGLPPAAFRARGLTRWRDPRRQRHQ